MANNESLSSPTATGELEHQSGPASLTPKRKPILSSTPRSSRTTPREKGAKVQESAAKPTRVSWPHPPQDFRRDHDEYHPGHFSPSYSDRSMQPPSHRGSIHSYSHNSHHRSTERPTRRDAHDPAFEGMEEEDMGADYLNLNLPVGSFAEDSPPRRKSDDPSKPRRSPKVSPSPAYPPPYGYPPYPHSHHLPPHHYYSSKSPGSSSYAASMYYGPSTGPPPKGGRRDNPPPPPHYPYPPPHHMGYRYYPPPYSMADPWPSPQAYETEFGGGKDATHKDIYQEPHTSQESPRSSSSPAPMDDADDSDDKTTTTTPEKAKMRSPFRSPPLSQTKKSPMFRSPGLGAYGSFGLMDTPGGTLEAEFSPMGPMRDAFGTGYPTLTLSRSNSDVDMDDASERESHHLASSPFSGFIHDFPPFSTKKTVGRPTGTSGGLQGVTRSPLLSEKRSSHTKISADRPSTLAGTASRPRDEGTKILASPMGPSSDTKPRKLWNESGPMRLELGGSSILKKSLEGINTMMRASLHAPTTATPSTATNRTAHNRLPPLANYRRLNTPIKLEPSPVQTAKGPPAANSSTKRAPPSSSKSTRETKLSRTSGKENVATPSAAKRSPCNCKKSRCLKLYCECFANELYCDSCNCTDCQNTAAFASVRDKAMKDTRAKNPNAFKPRISVKASPGVAVLSGTSPQSGHNMGCRCKRSECLKKYCECFQAGVMCGSKCKCVDCMNFAGSQKLIDKRRKIKDQRGAEMAMKVAEQTWKGPHTQHSARKMVARPAVQGMRPMPSPLGTPSHGRMPHHMPPHMMNPSPGHGGHPYMRPYAWGYSPIGMPPHVSPSGYGMYPPPPPHSAAPPSALQRTSPPSGISGRKPQMVEMPYAMAIASSKKTTPPKATPKPTEKITQGNDVKETLANKTETSPQEKQDTPTEEALPTPADMKTAPAKITPCQATPAPSVRLAYAPSTDKPKATKTIIRPNVLALFGSNMPKIPESEAKTIFSFVHGKDLASASFVCKLWNKVAKH